MTDSLTTHFSDMEALGPMSVSGTEMVVRDATVAVGWIFWACASGEEEEESGFSVEGESLAMRRETVRRRGDESTRRTRKEEGFVV